MTSVWSGPRPVSSIAIGSRSNAPWTASNSNGSVRYRARATARQRSTTPSSISSRRTASTTTACAKWIPQRGAGQIAQHHNDDHQFSTIRSVLFLQEAEDVLLIPNPGSGVVDVLLQDPIPGAQFILVDATGRVVMRATLEAERTALSTSGLPSGLYGFRVMLPSGQVTAAGTWVKQ